MLQVVQQRFLVLAVLAIVVVSILGGAPVAMAQQE